jgi:O-antigen/teichoic acid export membrane protein
LASIRRALIFSYVEKYGSYLIGLAATIIISRLLTPADIGAFSVGMGLVGIVAVIRELGISTYVIQEVQLTDKRIRAAFTLACSVGIVLALVVFGLSKPIGAFYGDPRVTTIVAVLALGFAITPLGSVAQSLVARNLEFGILTWIRLLHSLVQAGVGVVLAIIGFGPVSLAWAAVAAAVSNAVVSTWAKPHSHRPNFALHDLKRVIRVGGPTTATAMVEDIAASLPEMVLGRLQNLTAAGLFSRGRGLSQLAHQVIARGAAPVIFSEFALLRREGRSVAPIYIKTSLCVTALGWAGLGALAVLAESTVRILYGSQWGEVVPILRWLCAAAAVTLLTASSHHVLLASGGAMDALWTRLAWLPIHVVCLVVGAFSGPKMMAVGMVGSSLVSSAFFFVAVQRRTNITIADHMRVVRGSAPIAVLTVVCALPSAFMSSATLGGSVLALTTGGLGAAIGFIAGIYIGEHPLRAELARAVGTLRMRVNGRPNK